VPSRRKHWRICNIRDDGAINCWTSNYLPVDFYQVNYILIVTFLNVSFFQLKQNQLECEASSDGLPPRTNI
jgi:hypothetical protein